MEHAVALDDHLGIVEHQVAVSERPEVRLPPAEDDRHDVDRHVVDEPAERRQWRRERACGRRDAGRVVMISEAAGM